MAKSREPEALRGRTGEGVGDSSDSSPDSYGHWFRSSDDVREGYIRGIEKFDIRRVTYSVVEGLALFEGDIALGSPEAVEATRKEVESESLDDVMGRAQAASP